MPKINKLSISLAVLKERQHDGTRIFRSQEFKRADRERLLKHGFLQEVMKGWLVSASPQTAEGDTTPWFSSFWEFCSRYCNHRFGQDWHLSPQQSLAHNAEKTTVPNQVVVYSPRAQNNKLTLPFGTSLFCLKQKSMPALADQTEHDKLRLFCPEAALIRVPEDYFRQSPLEVSVVIHSMADPAKLLSRLLAGGHTTVAGRLAGVARNVGRPDFADEIVGTMKSADFDVRESNPFKEFHPPAILHTTHPHPIAIRLKQLWASNRELVVQAFPEPPKSPPDAESYMEAIDEIYQHDAYHSLSIEGYQVTAGLIEQVAMGDWDSEDSQTQRDRNTLAARGYYQAFKAVRAVLQDIYLSGDVRFARAKHRSWYRELFSPQVAAGLVDMKQLAGYRNQPVYLRGSRHVPPRWDVLSHAMPAFFDLLEAEPHPGARAILAHWLFGYIHPFSDGNGRIARFLMNGLLASAGYPWTVIHVSQRSQYLAALEQASVEDTLLPFVQFVSSQMRQMRQMQCHTTLERSTAR